MKTAHECQHLNEVWEAIDRIDHDIIALIARRATYVELAADFKKDEKAVRDKARVEQVIASKRTLAERYRVSPDLVERLYRTMIDFFVAAEMVRWNDVEKPRGRSN